MSNAHDPADAADPAAGGAHAPSAPGAEAEGVPDDVGTADLDPLAVMTQQRDEMRLAAQQIQADFENYKKRVARDQHALIERANERLLEELLPALDSFELAAVSLETGNEADLEKLSKGVALAIGQLQSAVERAGLLRIDASGAPFDPEEHEAVMHDDGDGEPIVEAVLRAGYKLKSRVLRPAMVKVTRTATHQ
jgi:molecular chaperone GrpE